MRRNFSSVEFTDSDPQFQPPKPSQYSDRSLMPNLSLVPGSSYSTMSVSPVSPVIRPAGEERLGCPPGRRPTRERIISRNMNGTSKYFVCHSPTNQSWPSNLTLIVWKTLPFLPCLRKSIIIPVV